MYFVTAHSLFPDVIPESHLVFMVIHGITLPRI